MKALAFALLIFLSACAARKKASDGVELPACLRAKIDSMAADPNEGAPQSVTRYRYRGQTVYYLKAPCCDKYNVVFDSTCLVLGYPDGGFTGRGDGKMTEFFNVATDGQVVWKSPGNARN